MALPDVRLPPGMFIDWATPDDANIRRFTVCLRTRDVLEGGPIVVEQHGHIDLAQSVRVWNESIVEAVSELWNHELLEWFTIDGRPVLEQHT